MIGNFLAKFRRKSRKYPIRRDAFGRSLRQRAFQAFGDGKRPAEVSRMVGISLRTACDYFADWKKHPEALDARYRLAAAVLLSFFLSSACFFRQLVSFCGKTRDFPCNLPRLQSKSIIV